MQSHQQHVLFFMCPPDSRAYQRPLRQIENALRFLFSLLRQLGRLFLRGTSRRSMEDVDGHRRQHDLSRLAVDLPKHCPCASCRAITWLRPAVNRPINLPAGGIRRQIVEGTVRLQLREEKDAVGQRRRASDWCVRPVSTAVLGRPGVSSARSTAAARNAGCFEHGSQRKLDLECSADLDMIWPPAANAPNSKKSS